MLSDSSYAFLKRLLETPGPSGYERAAAGAWRDEARAFARVSADVLGNSYAETGPEDGPVILLAGHVDEIGLIVTHVDEQGYVYVGPIGGWDPQVLVGSVCASSAARGRCSASSARSRST
jgi:endoglucanase